ncbi:TIM barrel protein [Bacillus subtilis]|uniref:hydroxypyruvate isomerase family protein n=1 Tax=Pseudochrobactrum asaccharolyticum TaxID=354351 RepID=UPI001F42C954|nr:TIM barrel protein [Pseudochrobactrum asaccharolyticum]MCF7645468.1 TIM barrel protein [Pseudochrobactrum asaccharolyticum]MCF7672080.1 TIM barrel protein [Bacillus subtilis]
MRFSANLGFLWNDLPLPEAIRQAKAAGFDAVECHWPYNTPAEDVARALTDTGLTMLGLNTRRGASGENGLLALPDRVQDARAAIDEAIAYAVKIKTPSVHVMAGNTSGDEAHRTYLENLRYACLKARPHQITILIEPLNPYDAPGYFLKCAKQAEAIIRELNLPELRLMFDVYHQQITGGDICCNFKKLLPIIGHVQIASVPERSRPDTGEINYRFILSYMRDLGWQRPVGAEYRPAGATEGSLGWLKPYQNEL